MPVKIDVIILSFAKDEQLKGLTIQTVDTLLQSEDPGEIEFNIIVIESNQAIKPYQFENTKTIFPNRTFGFNEFLNIGINATNNKYLCLCNNDLIFHQGWASALLDCVKQLNSNEVVLSPFCERSHQSFAHISEPVEGYFGYFAGYCFFTTREVLEFIGPLDQKISFWYADMDFIKLLEKYNIKHYLVPRSKVTHLVSRVTGTFTRIQHLRYTNYPRIYYRYKWDDKNLLLYAIRLIVYLMKYIFYSIQEIFSKIWLA